MDETWTLADLVAEAKTRLAALPPPKNGQVRAVPDDRTIRYYATLGLLDRPAAMRGRTALYGPRHLAQIVAIKRMQSAGHSLADVQQMWPTLDDATLSRISGVLLATAPRRPARKDFWKREPEGNSEPVPVVAPKSKASASPSVEPSASSVEPSAPVELRVEIAPGVSIVVALAGDSPVSISPADVRAVRVAAASLVTELANRGLIARAPGTMEEKP